MTGQRISIKGFKLDKSGKRVTKDPKQWDVSKRLKKAGAQRIKFGRRGG